MPSNINSLFSTNFFSNISLVGLLGSGTPSRENPNFNEAFASSLTGVFQTSERELVTLPEAQQTVGSALRDLMRADITGVRNQLEKLTKKSTKQLMQATGTDLKLMLGLRKLSGSSAELIESLSTLIAKMKEQGTTNFEIPKKLRVGVDDAIEHLTSVSGAVADIDKARPAAITPTLVMLVGSLGTMTYAAIKGLNKYNETYSAAASEAALGLFSTPQPASVEGVLARDIVDVVIPAAFGSLTALAAAYNLSHRAPALRDFTNALATYMNGLTELKASFSGPKEFSDFVNTAHEMFYAKPAELAKLKEDDFPPGAFDKKDDEVAAVADASEAAVADASEAVVGNASEGVVIEMVDEEGSAQNAILQSPTASEAAALNASVSSLEGSETSGVPLHAVVVEQIAPIPAPRRSMMGTWV